MFLDNPLIMALYVNYSAKTIQIKVIVVPGGGFPKASTRKKNPKRKNMFKIHTIVMWLGHKYIYVNVGEFSVEYI